MRGGGGGGPLKARYNKRGRGGGAVRRFRPDTKAGGAV